MSTSAPEPRTVELTGQRLLAEPLLNKGTAFTIEERDTFGLHGLLPTHVESIEQRVDRIKSQLAAAQTDIGKHMLLRDVQDYDETLFLRVLLDDILTTLPIVYTPVVGEACQRFSEIYEHPRGLFLSYPDADRMEQMLRSVPHDEVAVIVVTDGERILGLGDQGADGLGIPIGKLSLYSACGGIDPSTTLPIVLDVGTNNVERRNHPDYLGWRHERVVGPDYDAFVETFVQAVMKVFPDVLLQWEDFAEHHAHLLLDRYRDRLCTFNDDIQGTATVALGATASAMRQSGRKLSDQKIVIVGAGSAGSGIAEQLILGMIADGSNDEAARSQVFMVDRNGLLTDDSPGLEPFQVPLAQKRASLGDWDVKDPTAISLVEVIDNAKASVLIGVTGVFGLFTEEVIRAMGAANEQPVIFPLSNPTSKAEATAEDVLRWTDGRAQVATGSPFKPVTLNGVTYTIAQSNNAYIFPGMGLGIRASKATRVSDEMFMAAANALADASDAQALGDSLLPPLHDIRSVSLKIGRAVAKQAQAEGLAPTVSDDELDRALSATMWEPEYRTYVPAKA